MGQQSPGALFAVALAAALLPASASAAPEVIEDRMTGAQFVERPVMDGVTFRCLGVGGRKTFTFKIYSVAFCLEQPIAEEVVRQAVDLHPGLVGKPLAEALQKDERFFAALIRAPGEKMLVLRFARDIDQRRLSGAFRDSLEPHLAPPDLERMVAVLSSDVKEGEVATLRSDGTTLRAQMGLRLESLPNARAIEQALWTVWLGEDTPTPSLKESIARRAVAFAGQGGAGGVRRSITSP